MNVLYYKLDENQFNRMCICSSTKKIYDILKIIYEGTNKIKEPKISILAHEYEIFKMKFFESISNIFQDLQI